MGRRYLPEMHCAITLESNLVTQSSMLHVMVPVDGRWESLKPPGILRADPLFRSGGKCDALTSALLPLPLIALSRRMHNELELP